MQPRRKKRHQRKPRTRGINKISRRPGLRKTVDFSAAAALGRMKRILIVTRTIRMRR